MSGSETGVVTSREPYSVSFQKNPSPSPSPTQPLVQNMRLSYNTDGTTVYQPVTGSSPQFAAGADASAGAAVLPHNLNMNMGEPIKRKRGRPRKYGPDGSMALALIPAKPAATDTPSSGAFSPPQAPSTISPGILAPPSSSSFKKARGRPPGSSKKQQKIEALGSLGVGFTPHIITVKAGEDVSSKIMSFSQHGARAVCILSASGAISNVTLRQAATSGGTATYEGRFDILSLSGSFLLTEVGGQRSRTGGLSISLAGPDGRVLGGCVAGLLTAASPVQVIVGSFIAEGGREAKAVNCQMESPPLCPQQTKFMMTAGGGGGSRSPPSSSRGTLSESSGGGAGGSSPLNHQSTPPQGLSMSMSSMPWK